MAATLPSFPGTFVAVYSADVVADDPLYQATPDQRLLANFLHIPVPLAFVPQSTLAIFKFAADKTLTGKIQLNRGGFAPAEAPPLTFVGDYNFTLNADLQVYEGTINVGLQNNGQVFRTQVLYAVCQDKDTIHFMLRQTVDSSGTHESKTVVLGTMNRVK